MPFRRTNKPIFPDGRKIALVSPYFPSSRTDNNIHDEVLYRAGLIYVTSCELLKSAKHSPSDVKHCYDDSNP